MNIRLQSALDEEEAKEGGKGAENAEKSEEPKAAEETATPAAETTEQSSTEEASEATKKPESESTSKTPDEGTKEEGSDQQSEVMEVDNKDGAAAKKEVSTIYGFSCVPDQPSDLCSEEQAKQGGGCARPDREGPDGGGQAGSAGRGL